VLGLVLLRGDEVIALTIEGPPPADALTAKAQNAPVSPGQFVLSAVWPGLTACQLEVVEQGHRGLQATLMTGVFCAGWPRHGPRRGPWHAGSCTRHGTSGTSL
jgi:hypothetical protein